MRHRLAQTDTASRGRPPGDRPFGADRGQPVVAARLCGGLGNQLFQFAAGRSVAQRCGGRLILDATPLTLPQQRRKFALDPYPIDATVVFDGYAYRPRRCLAILPRPQGESSDHVGLVDRALHQLGKSRDAVEGAISAVVGAARRFAGLSPALRVFAEKSFDYDPTFGSLGANTYLEGYWQCYRYFDDVHDVICGELALPGPPNPANARWLARVKDANSVCLHVRRGDYLMAEHLSVHGVCSADYYARAMRLMSERVESPQFFVFSDDLAWCREHVTGANVAYVDANPPDAAHDELKLMASCRHHVIANSSLSWWGAWLARHDGQIVIGPDPWFSGGTETPDLFPPSWLTLPRD